MIQKESFDAVLFLDLGKKIVTVYDSSDESFSEVSVSHFFDWCVGLKDTVGSVLFIGEAAHFGAPRNPKKPSKAQYWTANELLSFYDRLHDAGHTLRLFPHKSTETIRRLNGWVVKEKNSSQKPIININGVDYNPDQVDCLAMEYAINQRPHLFESLQHPKISFDDPVRIEGMQMRNDMNIDKNYARAYKYKDPDDGLSKLILSKLTSIASNLSDEAKEAFGLDGNIYTKNGTVTTGVKVCQITAVACTLVDIDGNMRLRPSTQELAGWKFVKSHLLRLHAFHEKGGVARSDFMHHGAKNYISAKIDNKVMKEGGKKPSLKRLQDYSDDEMNKFYIYRNAYTKYGKELFQSIKKVLLSENVEQKSLEFAEV